MQDAVTKWVIQQFVINARTVTPDNAQQKEHLFAAYAFVQQQGYDELEAYYQDKQVDRNPFDIAKKSLASSRATGMYWRRRVSRSPTRRTHR